MDQVKLPGRNRNEALAVALLIVISLLCPQALPAANTTVEYQVKAAFLLNFTKFVEWPESAFVDDRSPFTICILGADPFGSTLDQLVSGETANRRKLVVERIRKTPEAKVCQVLFIGRAERDVPVALAGVGTGVLTVSEGEDFLEKGGMIRFVVENRRVRFDINQGAVETATLRMSSKLLSVARTVEK